MVITEKLDGTNGLVHIERCTFGEAAVGTPEGVSVVMDESEIDPDDGLPLYELWVRAGSRNRWLAPGSDNHGFAAYVAQNAVELARLGPGNHYGEWFGKGINRGYGLAEKRFALFNASRWYDPNEEADPIAYLTRFPTAQPAPLCATVVPVIAGPIPGEHMSTAAAIALAFLADLGSLAVPGFMNPEGVIVYHTAAGQLFKAFPPGNEAPKGAGVGGGNGYAVSISGATGVQIGSGNVQTNMVAA